MTNPPAEELPRIAVLLATHNGRGFIAEQLDSILGQESCSVDVWISDDHSSDGTWEWLLEKSSSEPRINLMPRNAAFGSASRNFYRLLREVDPTGYQYIALSDQDDIWFPNKLAVSIRQLRAHDAAAVSSNVVALWPGGNRRLIRKSQKQRRLDFLFESAGQGCTYLMTSACATEFRQFLMANRTAIESVRFHDWMLYAWTRSHAFRWHIQSDPTLLYRQHASNVHGANSGSAALMRRIKQVRSGWYREEILKISRLVSAGPTFTEECAATMRLVEARTMQSKLALAMKVRQLRRKTTDRALLLLACIAGWI